MCLFVDVASLSGDEQTIQQNIERMRHELGPDWLQGVHKALPEPGTGNDIQQNALVYDLCDVAANQPYLYKYDVCVVSLSTMILIFFAFFSKYKQRR